MSNYTHDDASNIPQHVEAHGPVVLRKPKTSSSSAFWFFIILAGLFVAAVNFVKVMGNDTPAAHGAATSHEQVHPSETRNEHTTEPAVPVTQTDPDSVLHSDDALMRNAASEDSLLPAAH